MMFCAVNEAFNKKGFQKPSGKEKDYYSYISTQGDYENKFSENEEDALSLPSNFTESENQAQYNLNHDYFTKKFISIIKGGDNYSEDYEKSSDISYVFDHVKKCNICQGKVKVNFRKSNVNQTNKMNIEGFDFHEISGMNLKEILLIVLVGIVIIFILDIIVKLGQRRR